MKKNIKIIAEAGCNHNGKLRLALKLVKAAKLAKADAVKFQMYDADELVTKNAQKATYALKNTKKKQSQYKMQKDLMLKTSEHLKIRKHCSKLGIQYMCSAFDIQSLNILKKMGIKEFKVPSGEINNYKYLKHLGKFKKKIILSTGMSNLKEISTAINILSTNGTKKKDISILQCNSQYPTPYTDVNLQVINTLKKTFKLNVGISDHTQGYEVPIAAATFGIKIIEKHLTLNKKLFGPDHQSSLNPLEFKAMVRSVRNIEKAMGSKKKIVTKSEKKNIKFARKSLVAIKKIKKNDFFTFDNIGIKRPGNGIPASSIYKIIGKKSKFNFNIDQLIKK